MKRIKNKKGFTLIELLAAVVILGILMLVAIPRVSKYIDNSRKDAFVDIAKAYIQDARYKVLNGEYTCTSGQTIAFADLNVEKGTKSPYSGKDILRNKSYVKVNESNGVYTYEVLMQDSGGNGWTESTAESALSRSSVTLGTGTVSDLSAANKATTCTP